MHINLKVIQIFLLLNSTLIYPNIRAQGLIFDEKKFNKREKLKVTRAETYPDSFSLKAYVSEIYEQQNSTCVAYSIATARTIAYAYQNKITDKKVINSKMFSPHWVYYRNKESNDNDCSKGLNIEKAINDLIKNGIPYMSSVEYPEYYPFSQNVLCGKYPPNMKVDSKEAIEFRVKAIYRITSIEGIKYALSKGMPVIAAMNLPLSFKEFSSELYANILISKNESHFNHCFVLIGFNDIENGGYIEIVNSWGNKWGRNGYIKMSYSEFLNYVLGVYALPNN